MSSKPPTYIIGLDLGKKRDFTALIVLERKTPNFEGEVGYNLIHLHRWRGRDYRAAVPEIDRVKAQIQKVGNDWMLQEHGYFPRGYYGPTISTVVDQTGVGEAVVENLRAAGLECVGIIIHGGEKATRMESGDGWRVPKRELVGTVEVLLQNHRLHIADSLPMADVLVNELRSFKATIKLSGHVSYAASEEWREGDHDDTVLALAMAAWHGETQDPYAWDAFDQWMVSNAD